MPPRDRLEHPGFPLPEDTAPVGPCAPFEQPGGEPSIFLPPAQPDVEGKISAAMEETMANLRAELQKMADGYNRIVAAVRAFADVLGAEIVEAARVVLERVREIVEAAIDVVLYIMEHYAPLAALHLTAMNWQINVKKPMTGLSGLIEQDASDNLSYWKGEAASKYKTKIGKQKGAVLHIGANADHVGDWLMEVFKANVAYTTPLLDLLSGLAAKIGAAALKAGTGFGIPDAINILKDELEEVIRTLAKFVTDAVKRVVDAIGNSYKLLDYFTDDTNLPGNKWPQAVRN